MRSLLRNLMHQKHEQRHCGFKRWAAAASADWYTSAPLLLSGVLYLLSPLMIKRHVYIGGGRRGSRKNSWITVLLED